MHQISSPTSFSVRRGYSRATDEATAVRELHAAIHHQDAVAAIIFVSSRYNLDLLGPLLNEAFTCPTIACTTSGEITPEGYQEGGLTGLCLVGGGMEVHKSTIAPLSDLSAGQLIDIGHAAREHLALAQRHDSNARAFAMLLIDGLSVMEEQVVGHLNNYLGGIPLIGGSAGDDMSFAATHILAGERFISNAAVFGLFITSLPFEPFKFQHFVPTDKRIVITAADPARRIVREIDGKPAAEIYARLVGVDASELNPMVFSNHPMMLKVGGEYYVRSIQKANDDGSLTFFCAIDEGLVLTMGTGADLVENLERRLSAVAARVPNFQTIIGCECILRRLEVIRKGLTEPVNRLLAQYNVIGFHSYGEQFNAIHVNQTFTGIAIGS